MKNKPEVVIDTNIFLYGWFDPEKNECQLIMDLIDNRKLQLLFSQDTIGELVYATKNSARHNLDDVKSRIIVLESIMTLFYYSTSVNTLKIKEQNIKISDDPFDNMFIECAIAGNADYLITDDFKSGLHTKGFNEFQVLSSKDFIPLFT